jgi:hypothetical protein
MDVEGWCGNPELYARLLFFDQPFGGVLDPTTRKQIIERLNAHTAWASHRIADAAGFDDPNIRKPIWQDEEPPPWVYAIRKLLSIKSQEIWITRANPNWRYYTANKNKFSVTELGQGMAWHLRLAFGSYNPVAIEQNGRCILRPPICSIAYL